MWPHPVGGQCLYGCPLSGQGKERGLLLSGTFGEGMEGRAGLSDRIFCMDCMDLFPQIPDGYVSMILSDPPYGISYQNHFTRTRHQVLDGDGGMDYGLLARESYRILRKGHSENVAPISVEEYVANRSTSHFSFMRLPRRLREKSCSLRPSPIPMIRRMLEFR